METKYIFITGGVASSLGKGIISASLGKLLQARGYRITIQKFDPYINIDPGTLNPYEHGECYVTADGMETDLDLGHYERFTGIEMTRNNSVTTGQIYLSVIERERRGDYLGKTIQVVPHITDEIKRRILLNATKRDLDFVITEIGGTIGDIEGQPFLEAIRQLRWELGPSRALNVHLTYVPYLAAAGELKTKPTQTSVKQLQGLGIQPEVLVLRTEHELNEGIREKVAHFCNVDVAAVIQSQDLPSIYEVPVNMQHQGLDAIILKKMGVEVGETPELGPWRNFLELRKQSTEIINIGLVGKYDLQDAYKSILESLAHAGTYNHRKVKTHFINSEHLTQENVVKQLSGMNGIVICPGFGTLGYKDANSREMDEHTPHNVIDLMEEQKSITQMGGTMRLGAYECQLVEGSKAFSAYTQTELSTPLHNREGQGGGSVFIKERHRHRYEFNNRYLKEFEKAGMKGVGVNPAADLVEIVEIPEKRWYIGTQFHPEYSSTVLHPHPLFMSFIKADKLKD